MRLIRARHLITVTGVYMYDVERTDLVSVGPRIVRRHATARIRHTPGGVVLPEEDRARKVW